VTNIAEVREPWVELEVLCRKEDVGAVMQLVQDRRGVQKSVEYLDADLVLLRFEVPLQGIVLDFFDQLKSATSGYGSMSYEPVGYRAGDLLKLQILLLSEPAERLLAQGAADGCLDLVRGLYSSIQLVKLKGFKTGRAGIGCFKAVILGVTHLG